MVVASSKAGEPITADDLVSIILIIFSLIGKKLDQVTNKLVVTHW